MGRRRKNVDPKRVVELVAQGYTGEEVAVDVRIISSDSFGTAKRELAGVFIVGAVNALNLLLEPQSCEATLRF